MKIAANTMTNKITNDAITIIFRELLDCMSYIAKASTGNSSCDTRFKAIACNLTKCLCFLVNCSTVERPSVISRPTVNGSTSINGQNIAILQNDVS